MGTASYPEFKTCVYGKSKLEDIDMDSSVS